MKFSAMREICQDGKALRPLTPAEQDRLAQISSDWTRALLDRAEEVGRKRRKAIEGLDDGALKAALLRQP